MIRPQGLIGEKFVECEPGSRRPRQLAQIENGAGEGERLLPLDQHQLAGRHRPAQRHPAAAVPPALRDPAERVRHGPGRPRRRAQRGHPPRQPGAARDRQAAGDPRPAEPLARPAGARLRRGARPAGARARRVSDWIVQANATGEASAERARRHQPRHRPAARLPAQAEAADGRPRRPSPSRARRCCATWRRRAELDRLIKASGTLSKAANESFPSLGDALELGRPALIRARPLIQDLRKLGTQAAPADEEPRPADGEPPARPAASSASTTSSTTWRSAPTATTRSATTCAPAWSTNDCSSYVLTPASARTATRASTSAARGRERGPVRPQREVRARGAAEQRQRQPAGHPAPGPARLRRRPGSSRASATRGSSACASAAAGRSEALAGEEPMLDYLLGGER